MAIDRICSVIRRLHNASSTRTATPLGRNRRNGSMLCTSPDNSRYARRIFPSTLPVVVPSPAAPNRTGNRDIVVPAPIRPGNSDGDGGP